MGFGVRPFMAGYGGPQEAWLDVYHVRPCLFRCCRPRGIANAHPVSHAEQSLPVAPSIQSAFHDARYHYGLSGRDAADLLLCELSCATHDRRTRPGLPATQRLRLLVECFRRFIALL